MPNKAGDKRPRYSKYFWVPIWILLAGCAIAGSFLLGGIVIEQQRLLDDNADLAVEATHNLSGALIEATERLTEKTKKHIEFPLYLNLLQEALGGKDSEVRDAAYQSINMVLNSHLALAKDLKGALASMPTQIFIVTSKEGASAGENFEQKLKNRMSAVVIPETRDVEISNTEVHCYDSDVCNQTVPAVINLLKEEGYDVSDVRDPTKPEEGAPFKNRIEIILPDPKKNVPPPTRRPR